VAGGPALKQDFEALLKPLRIADNDYLDELQPLAQRALAALRSINAHIRETRNDPSRLADAKQEFATFSIRVAEGKDKAKALLSGMSDAANKLIDRLVKGS